MSVSDADIQLLEGYLDGAIGEVGAAQLRRRMEQDAELHAAMEDVKLMRGLRRQAWADLEPTDVMVEQLNWRIEGEAQRTLGLEQRMGNRRWVVGGLGLARFGAAAAACVVLGFAAGWLGRGNQLQLPRADVTPPADHRLAQNSPEDSTGGLESVKLISPRNVQTVSVPITDNYGRIVGWQTVSEPRGEEDQTPHSNPSGDGPVKLVGSEKF